MTGPQYWTIVRNEVAYTPTQAEGIYTSETDAQTVVEALWAEGKEAVVVPLIVEAGNPIYRTGVLEGFEATFRDLAEEITLVDELDDGFTVWMERQTYRDIQKYRKAAE